MNDTQKKPMSQGAVGGTHEHLRSREDGDLRQLSDSPACHDHINRTASEPAPRYGGRGVNPGETQKRPTKLSSENSIQLSPLHHQARSGRGVRAPPPAWEGKSSYEGSHGTPGRPRARPSASGDETPDESAAVPKFGDWDENNPAASDGYTRIFDKVLEERQTVRAPGLQTESSSHDYYRRQTANNDSAKSCCCLPWRKR